MDKEELANYYNGNTVNYKGKQWLITNVYEDGMFELTDINLKHITVPFEEAFSAYSIFVEDDDDLEL